jgi:hypothetical protein
MTQTFWTGLTGLCRIDLLSEQLSGDSEVLRFALAAI